MALLINKITFVKVQMLMIKYNIGQDEHDKWRLYSVKLSFEMT
jgi:hypothetical protein